MTAEASGQQGQDGRAARQDQALVTAAEWFAGGQRIWYGPDSARLLTAEQAAAAPGALRVFERVAASRHGADAVWLTMLPGFPDGSYGWAQVDTMLGDDLGPRLMPSRKGRVTPTSPGTTGTPLWSGRT
jgi:hypothetical protein